MKKLLVLASVVLAFAAVHAELTGYLMLSLFSPGQLPSAGTSINGGKLNVIYGESRNLSGIDLGIASYNREHVNGLSVNLFNGSTDMAGFQAGAINNVESDAYGVQFGAIYNYGCRMTGVQIGLVNGSRRMTGLQLGAVNFTERLAGVQIGVANFVFDDSIRFLPFVNARF